MHTRGAHVRAQRACEYAEATRAAEETAAPAGPAEPRKELFNSSLDNAEWKAFTRLCKNKKRCPVALRERADIDFHDAFAVSG